MRKRIENILIKYKNELLKRGEFPEQRLVEIAWEKQKAVILEKFKLYIDKSTEEFAAKVIDMICQYRLDLKNEDWIGITYNEYTPLCYFNKNIDLIEKHYRDVIKIISDNPEWSIEDSLSTEQRYALAYYMDYELAKDENGIAKGYINYKYRCVSLDKKRYYLVDIYMFLDMIDPIIPKESLYQEELINHFSVKSYLSVKSNRLDNFLLHMENDKRLDDRKSALSKKRKPQ